MNYFLMFLYKLIVDFCYYIYISEVPIWNGRYVKNWDVFDYVCVWLVYAISLFIILPIFASGKMNTKLTQYITLLLLILSYVPGISMCGMGAFPTEYVLIFYVYWLFFLVCLRFISHLELKKSINDTYIYNYKRMIFYTISLLCIVSVLVYFYKYGNGMFFTASLISDDVYDIRRQWSNIIVPLPLQYILANVLIVMTILLMYLLENKRYVCSFLVIIVQYIYFSCGANKTVLFTNLFCLLIYFFRKYLCYRNIIIFFICLLPASMFIYAIIGDISLLTFVRRTMFDTNIISSYCFDYFIDKACMLQEMFNQQKYIPIDIAQKIGSIYFNNPENCANNGLIGDGISLFGAKFAFLEALLWSIYLYILEIASKKMTAAMRLVIGINLITIMQNSAFTTSMLSHGCLAMLVMAYCLPLENSYKGDC